jgi:hypothetical protein
MSRRWTAGFWKRIMAVRSLPDLSPVHPAPKIMSPTRRLQAFGDPDERPLD